MAAPTIFVIDDHEIVRHALGEMLSVFGFTVETYDSADTFLQAIDQRGSGCVVADVRMPGTDGIELVRELGRRKIALPIVLISGHADVPMAVAAIKSGAEDFIEKPVDDTQLVAAINRALARTFEQQDLRKSQEAFTAAGVVALLAYHSGADRHAGGITPWDVAGVFALIWVVAGMLSEPEHVVQLFDHITMTP